MKTCSQCATPRPLSAFYVTARGGRFARCRHCVLDYQRQQKRVARLADVVAWRTKERDYKRMRRAEGLE